MDTKQLYYALKDNGVPLDENHLSEAENVWIDAIMCDEVDLRETLIDNLAEMDDETYSGFVAGIKHIMEIVISNRVYSSPIFDGIVINHASAIAMTSVHLINDMITNHRDQVEKFVKSYSLDWIHDCAGYQLDMDKYEGEV